MKLSLSRLLAGASVLSLSLLPLVQSGCSGGTPETMNMDTADGGGGASGDYPSDNLGVAVGQQVYNMSFLYHPGGLADKGNTLQKVTMADYYAQRTQGAKLLYISGAAEWCGPCQLEALLLGAVTSGKVYQCQASSCTCSPILDAEKANTCDFCADLTKKPADCLNFADTLKAKGWENAFRLLQLVLQDKDHNRSDQPALERWETNFSTRFPVGIDPKQTISGYIPENAVPQSLFIKLANMTLQRKDVGTPQFGAQMMQLLLGEIAKAAK